MKDDTIEDGELTPLNKGRYSKDGTNVAPRTNNQHRPLAILRAGMVGATFW